MASPINPSPDKGEGRGGGWSINDLPTPPSLRLLGWLGAALFVIALLASLLFALLVQRVIATSDAPAQLDTAIAATVPITTVNLPHPAPVVLLVIGDLHADQLASLPSLQALPAARWQIGDAIKPPETYLATLLHGTPSGALAAAPDHLFASAARDLTDTLATITPRTSLPSLTAPAYLDPFSDAATISEVISDTASGERDLVIATLRGLTTCPQPATCAANLDTELQQTLTAARSVSATLVVVGDYSGEQSGPLLLFSGPLIKTGSYGAASLRDVAPTIAALLGASPPVLSDGQILWPALNLPAASAAVAEYDLAVQRTRLAEATTALTGQPLPLAAQIRADLLAAYEALLVPDYPSATGLSSHTFSAVTQQLAAVRQGAGNTATWPRLPVLLLVLAIALAAFIQWRRQLGYARPILFYVVLALASLLLEIALLLLIGQFVTLDFSALPTDWLDPGAIVISALAVTALGQIALGSATALLYNRAHRRALPSGPQQTRASEVAIWQLRLAQPLSGPTLWGAAYTAALTLLTMLIIAAAALYWQYGFAPDLPSSDPNATFVLLYVLALSAANALFATFLAPLAALAAYNLTHRRKPHPLLVRPPAKKGKQEPEPLGYRRDKWG